MPVPVADFPDMVGDVEVDVALTWDFKLPSGVTLTGTPTVTVSVYSGTDADPQSRLVSRVVGTAVNGISSCAVLAKFGPGLSGVRYLFTTSCANSAGGVSACFNKMLCRAPG